MIGLAANVADELEVGALTGAGHGQGGEKSAGRLVQRNGKISLDHD